MRVWGDGKMFKRVIRSKEFIFFVVAFVMLALFTKSSFLYPLNDWGDVNCYFTIGAGILDGKVPYRDLFDQKGPFIFGLYAIANLISSKSYIGGFLLETVSAWILFILADRIVSIFAEKYSPVLNTIIFGTLVFTSQAMCHGGSAEEFMLPEIMYALLVMFEYTENRVIPGKKRSFILGICAGIIFWSKYTLCAGYIAVLIIMMAVAIKRNDRCLLNSFRIFVLGCVVSCIPVFIYFAADHSLPDLINGYFYDNIFVYGGEKHNSGVQHLVDVIKALFRKRNIPCSACIVAGAIWLHIKNRKRVLISLFIVAAALLVSEFSNAWPQAYYALPFSAFAVFGLIPLCTFFKENNLSKGYQIGVMIAISAVLCLLACCSSNWYMLLKPKSETPQYQFAEKIEDYKNKNCHMLYYGNLDQGFYFAAQIKPNCKAFIQTNLPFRELKDMQYDYVRNGKEDFIVSEDKVLCDRQDEKYYKCDKKDRIIAFDGFRYKLVDEVDNWYFEHCYHTYRLYMKKK